MKNNHCVLAVYPNGRGFGFALMASPKEPIDARTLEVGSKSLNDYLRRIGKLIDYYRPTILIVENIKTPTQKKSKRIKKLLEHLRQLAKEKTLKLRCYTREQIVQTFASFEATTRYEIAKCIYDWLPELGLSLPRVKKIWESEQYDMGAYDALSLAFTHYYLE